MDVLDNDFGDFGWVRDVGPTIVHDRSKPFTVDNIPHHEIDTKVYDRFCEFYGKEYMDSVSRFNCNIFKNENIISGMEPSVQIWIKPKPYNFGEIDETGWSEAGWFHTSENDDTFYVEPCHRYEYHQFLTMLFTETPVWG